jgi:hypothetical protein
MSIYSNTFRIWSRKLEVQDDVTPLFDLAESDLQSYQEVVDKILVESNSQSLKIYLIFP